MGRYCVGMAFLGLVALMTLGQATPEGYITVKSNLPGLRVFLEGEFLGRTPIENEPVEPGSYMLSVASNDSLERLYDNLRHGGLSRKLSSVWSLTGIDAGTQRVEIESRNVTEVFVDYGAVLSAPTKAKWTAGCGVGGVFGLGAILGLIIGLIVS